MYLADHEIAAAVERGDVSVAPVRGNRYRPASYLLSLGPRVMTAKTVGGPIDPFSRNDVEDAFHPARQFDQIELTPGELVLAATHEVVAIGPRHFGRITGMSHVARLGLAVHVASDFISPGFGSDAPTAITLELVNHHPRPLLLRAGMPVCHLQIGVLSSPSSRTYDLLPIRYGGVEQPTGSLYWREFGVPSGTSERSR